MEAVGIMGGYEHFWSPRWSSNALYSVGLLLNDVGDANSNERIDYGAVNLLYWFLERRAWIGAEYLYVRRELRSGSHGSANRLQIVVRFNIPG